MLYLIEILHQTTTLSLKDFHDKSCILSKFYIKPQPGLLPQSIPLRCILSKFYIKPQRSGHPVCRRSQLYLIEILHQTTTLPSQRRCDCGLYLIEILHQTTTTVDAERFVNCCILSKFYIKPQHWLWLFFSTIRCILSKFYIKPQRRASY